MKKGISRRPGNHWSLCLLAAWAVNCLACVGSAIPALADSQIETIVLASVVDNPNPYQTTGEMFRWLGEVDARYYGSCEIRGTSDHERLPSLERFIADVNGIGADVSLSLTISDCDQNDIAPRSGESFGIAIIVGGGVQRVIALLEMGRYGDGSEFILPDIQREGDQVTDTGCLSFIGKRNETGRILAGVVYVDPAYMMENTDLCIRTTLLSSLGFSGRLMASYPESLLAFVPGTVGLPNLDRCLIEMLYAPVLEGQVLTITGFRERLPSLIKSSRFCKQ